jgi:uncharacterized protein (TIGR02300 family)
VAREELGTKRICPETGKKFYDLNKAPIVSPYTGKQYPLTFFEEHGSAAKAEPKVASVKPAAVKSAPEEDEDDDDVVADGAPEFISLEDADEGADDDDVDEEIPDIPDVEIEVDDDATAADGPFLDDEDDEDDLTNVIGEVEGKEEI